MEQITEKKPKLTAVYILLSILIIAVCASIVLSALALHEVQIRNEEETQETTQETQENDVVIADEYKIESTENISDAYKSGDTSGLDDKDLEILNLASAVIDEVITDGMTDYEKEKAIYDWMVVNVGQDTGSLPVVPTTDEYADDPYGALKYHEAVCVGYATTFRLFMQMMDIPCMVVHNVDCYHSWDLVQLDGDWYHTDIYSDHDGIKYMDFNMDDIECMNNGHDWDMEFFPSAEGTKYSYVNQIAQDVESVDELPGLVRDAMDSKENMVAYRFDIGLENQIYYIQQKIEEYLYNSDMMGVYLSSDTITYTDDSVLICYAFMYDESYDDPDIDYDLDDETTAKLDEAVAEAFGDIYSEDTSGVYDIIE